MCAATWRPTSTPLGIEGSRHHPELDPKSYGFTDADYGREFFVDGVLGFQRATLQQILDAVRKTYCGTIGVEFMHIQSPDEKSWIQRKFEGTRSDAELGPEEKKRVLSEIFRSEGFEKFLSIKYPGSKRFSLEGGESTIAAMETIIRTAARGWRRGDCSGYAPSRAPQHPGPTSWASPMLRSFRNSRVRSSHPDAVHGSGDVKYHLGTSEDRQVADGRKIHLSLTANPSHLEAVNPVVEGKVRAKQEMLGDEDRKKVLAILLHGDAAFAGQGPWLLKLWACRNCAVTRPAARSTSSSTTRSVSRPIPASRVPRPIQATSPRWSRHRFSM